MRDVGILIWVILIIVGVVGSMISSVRKQVQAQQPGRDAPASGSPPQPPQQLAPQVRRLLERRQPAAASSPAQATPRPRAPVHVEPAATRTLESEAAARPRRKPAFFGRRSDLVRAVIAAEVLRKPRAFSDEHFPH